MGIYDYIFEDDREFADHNWLPYVSKTTVNKLKKYLTITKEDLRDKKFDKVCNM